VATDPSKPLAEIHEEAHRVAAALDQTQAPLRLLGGAAIWLRCPSAEHPLLRRNYADLDFISLRASGPEVKRFLVGLGYEADKYFNSLHGRSRLLFHDTHNERQVDVLFDEMLMCHRLDFRKRINVDQRTLPLADLLLTKLQIVETNPKDMTDMATILFDHAIGEQDGEAINGAYIAGLTANDWGLYRTIQINLEAVRQHARSLPQVGQFAIGDQVDALWAMIEAAPKTLKWKMRAQVGDRVKWYELPEEVRRS
jgi:hypothetical protein